VVYGEVLITPGWTQPSQSENGGATPPPEPILPTSFAVQLYNPDQQITIRYKHKTWNSPAAWEFEMPQHSFRQPSASTLDHALTDPATADVTPKLKFSWRKDSKLSKDLTCLLSGTTSTMSEGGGKTKSKEPDITVSIYKALRELTLYEPNLYRVEMEDFKGLEVVLLLGAVTIRDVYFQPVKDAFRVLTSAAPVRPGGPAAANAAAANKPTKPAQQTPTASGGLNPASTAGPAGAPPRPRITIPERESRPLQQEQRPQRSQAEVEAENARRQKQQGGKTQEDPRRSKAEEKARRKRQEEIDKETRRLQKLYGREEAQARTQTPASEEPKPRPPPRPNQQHPARHYYRPSAPQPGPRPGPGPYLHVPGQDGRHHSSMHFLQPRPQSTAAIRPAAPARPDLQPKKSSFFGFRRASGPDDGKLSKKRSSMF
jgi:hypothetical protein